MWSEKNCDFTRFPTFPNKTLNHQFLLFVGLSVGPNLFAPGTMVRSSKLRCLGPYIRHGIIEEDDHCARSKLGWFGAWAVGHAHAAHVHHEHGRFLCNIIQPTAKFGLPGGLLDRSKWSAMKTKGPKRVKLEGDVPDPTLPPKLEYIIRRLIWFQAPKAPGLSFKRSGNNSMK